MSVISPVIVSNFLNESDFNRLVNHFKDHKGIKKGQTDQFGRISMNESSNPLLTIFSKKILPFVRDHFNDQTILPSYSLFAEYSDKNIYLEKHKDGGACTYTVDLVLYQKTPWGLWIDGKEYLANENDAIVFMGEDQEHWREPISDNNDKTGLIYFHYVKPDHWWYTNPEWRNV